MPGLRCSRRRRRQHLDRRVPSAGRLLVASSGCGFGSSGVRLVAVLAASAAAGVTAAEVELRPLPQVTPCTEFLRQVGEEFYGLSVDVLDRFALASDLRGASSLPDRFALLAARGLADGLLRLTEAAHVHFCLASRCGHCPTEVGRGSSAERLVGEVGLSTRFRSLIQKLLSFADLFEAAALAEEREQEGQEQGRSRPSSGLVGQREKLAAARRSVQRLEADGAVEALEQAFVEVAVGEGGPAVGGDGDGARLPDGALEALFLGAAKFRGAVGKLHGAVIQALDVLPLLALASRTGGAAAAAFSRAPAMAGFLGSGPTGRDAQVPWPDLVELAQALPRPTSPSSRTSALCDADAQRLFRRGPLAAELQDSLPYKDSSGAFSWHGAPVMALLEAMDRYGSRRSYNYWAIFPEGMQHRAIACEDSHGIVYDPTACLEAKGWGGSQLYVAPTPREGGRRPVLVERRLRPWAAGAVASGSGSAAADGVRAAAPAAEEAVWPIDPPRDPVDVLFLHPVAGNCALLPDLVTEEGSPVRLIYVPINPMLPPPLRAVPDFEKYWQRHLAWGMEATQERGMAVDDWVYSSMSYHFLAQCSLMQVTEMLRPRGFQLLFVEHLYAVFAPAAVARALPPQDSSGDDGGSASAGQVRLFEAWRSGWFCSPLSRTILLLEQRAQMDFAWLAIGGLRNINEEGESEAAVAGAAVCDFLRKQSFVQDEAIMAHSCDSARFKIPPMPEVADLGAAVALRRRVLWALELQDPLPGVAHHLGAPSSEDDDFDTVKENRGCCWDEACECFAPYRGPRCDIEDAGSDVARNRPFRAAVNYIVNDEDVHIAELLYALRNLWRRFNHRFDYPVLIFHDGLSPETRTRIVLAAPHRIWFHRLPDDFLPDASELPPDLREEDEESEASHHSFSAGYRAQSRFRSGPVFAHGAVRRLDYLLGLDGDSMFPKDLEEDPFEVMHRNSSLVLGYRYITVTSATSSKYFWDTSLLYSGYTGVDVAEASRTKGSFLKKFLMAPQGWNEAPSWNLRVVMTDCELLRVSFFAPGTEYYKYYKFLDALKGFWLYRWGDHAVRGLGTAIALWLQGQQPQQSNGAPAQAAYEMKIPYAHQSACYCEDSRLMCVSLGKVASGEPLWPAKKKIWECQVNASAVKAIAT